MIASDLTAFDCEVKTYAVIPDESVGWVQPESVDVFSVAGESLVLEMSPFQYAPESRQKGEFAHFMLKEIYEQPRVIMQTVQAIAQAAEQPAHDDVRYHSRLFEQLRISRQMLTHLSSITCIAAGTSWHAGRIAQFFAEYFVHIPVRVHLASEFRCMPFFPDATGVYIFISQSGETADTLEALRMVQERRVHTVALTNVATSSLVREAAGSCIMQAGPEVSVASTKAFSCQLASLYLIAGLCAQERGTVDAPSTEQLCADIAQGVLALEAGLNRYAVELTYEWAPRYAQFDRMIFLGRHINYPFALEAALKLKEISYIFAQCYPAGELKHGPIALIDDKTPVVIFSVLDPVVYEKLVANAQEVRARRGQLIVFAFAGQHELIALASTVFIFELVPPLLAPLAMTGVMQLFAYTITNHLGHAVDRPRNLAKSVTVE